MARGPPFVHRRSPCDFRAIGWLKPDVKSCIMRVSHWWRPPPVVSGPREDPPPAVRASYHNGSCLHPVRVPRLFADLLALLPISAPVVHVGSWPGGSSYPDIRLHSCPVLVGSADEAASCDQFSPHVYFLGRVLIERRLRWCPAPTQSPFTVCRVPIPTASASTAPFLDRHVPRLRFSLVPYPDFRSSYHRPGFASTFLAAYSGRTPKHSALHQWACPMLFPSPSSAENVNLSTIIPTA